MKKIKLRINDKTTAQDFYPNRTAIIIIDVWDDHWCKYYKELNDKLAPKIGAFVEKARQAGMTIIHAPCSSRKKVSTLPEYKIHSCMPYYSDHQARKNALSSPRRPNQTQPPRLADRCQRPNDIFFKGVKHSRKDKFCTCVPFCDRSWPRPWNRQHDAISVSNKDYVSDNLKEIEYILYDEQIHRIFCVGGALNACLIDRPISMHAVYKNIYSNFIRDLTASHLPRDEVFNISPMDADSHHWHGRELRAKFKNLASKYDVPLQGHNQVLTYDAAHEIQSKYIEEKMCPSILSKELLDACTP